MNVLVVARTPSGGGSRCAVRYAVNLVGALARRPGTRVTVLGDAFTLACCERVPPAQLVDDAGIDSDRAALEQNDIVIQIDQYQPRPVELPTAVVVHDLAVHDVDWAFGPERAALVRSLHKNVIRADAVVSGHPYVLQRVVELEPLAAGKTVLTVAPLDSAAAEPDAATIADVRRRFGLGDGRPTVVYPAAVRPEKNHWNLLATIGELQRSGREIQLLCVGDAPDAQWAGTVQRRVDYLGLAAVRFPGRVEGVARAALLHEASAVVSTSLADPAGAVALEALESHAAVACAATPGVLAQLDRIGLEVPTFDPYDLDSTVAALERLLDDAEGITATYGAAREVVATWTWERLADEIVSALEVVES